MLHLNLNKYIEDADIWKLVNEGNEESFELLYRRYIKELYTFAMCFTSNPSLAEDAIQDVFIKIFQAEKDFSSIRNIKTYLYTAVRNQLFNLLREEISTVEFEDCHDVLFMGDFSMIDSIEENDISKRRRETINVMLSQLSSRQKEVIYLRFIKEMSYHEIEQIMKINYQSIQNLIQRGLLTLRKKFNHSEWVDSLISIGYIIFIKYL